MDIILLLLKPIRKKKSKNEEDCEQIINNMELIVDVYEIDGIGPIEFPLIITPLYE